MPRILHIQFRRGRPERFLVQWDTGEEQLFSPEICLKYGFAPGKEFSGEALAGILHEDAVQQAKDQALRYLTYRPHSRQELLRKTVQKGYPPEAVEEALDALEKVDLVNDETFARLFIENELLLRPCGRRLLKEKLLAKGVSPELFEPLLEEAYAQKSEERIAGELAAKFLAKHSRPLPEALRERLIRYLQRRGFSWEVIRWVLYDSGLMEEERD
ncbi:MAG: regulatory protein RecX [Calditrichaeota bacterium]|nr:MAG: regulatory protein RecX [Calditrichota bacterium]